MSEPNYCITKWFSEVLLVIEMKKTKKKINKPVYLGLSILDISKILMHEFSCDYIKQKYKNNAKLYYMDTNSFIIHTKTEVFYKDIADHVEKIYDTSNYEVDGSLPKGMNKKVIDLMKHELGGKSIKEFVALRRKAYSYITDDNKKLKKLKEQKSV